MNGTWTQVAKLLPIEVDFNDGFGLDVEVSGETIIVGAWQDDTRATNAGAAYVFERVGGAWVQTVKLTASDAAAQDGFGVAIEMSNDTIAVAAFNADPFGVNNAGAVYVFERGAAGWSEVGKLVASSPEPGAGFGRTVAINGDVMLIDTRLEDEAGADSGVTYVFERTAGVWIEAAKLSGNDTLSGDNFGAIGEFEGGVATLGAVREDEKGADAGAAYLFQRLAGTWRQRLKIVASDGAAGDLFGIPAMSGGTIYVASLSDDNANGKDAGAVYIYEYAPDAQVMLLQEAVSALIEDDTMSLNNGAALLATLDSALQTLESGNETAGANQLNAFINQVNALVNSGRLTMAEGQVLVDAAQSILDGISGS